VDAIAQALHLQDARVKPKEKAECLQFAHGQYRATEPAAGLLFDRDAGRVFHEHPSLREHEKEQTVQGVGW